MIGRIESICTSRRKGERKTPVPSIALRTGHGLEGDAHAGPGHRQVSLLDAADIATMRAAGLPDLKPGDFAENLAVSGLDLSALGLGSRLRIGSLAEIAITQIGKVCHDRCAIYHQAGDCIMPRRGLFARVLADGLAAPGDPVAILETVPRARIQGVVLTISDRCLRGEPTDTSGPAMAERLLDALDAHRYAARTLPDEPPRIEAALRHYADGHSIDLILAIDGTGVPPRNASSEAVRAVTERLPPGMDDAMLSRAVSGIRQGTLIVSLPGSDHDAAESIEAILPALAHALTKLRGDAANTRRARTDRPPIPVPGRHG